MPNFKSELTFNQGAWIDIEEKVIFEFCVPRMEKVAEACNAGLDNRDEPGYIVSTAGKASKILGKSSFRATVITATNEAMADNAENNTLINNLPQASG